MKLEQSLHNNIEDIQDKMDILINIHGTLISEKAIHNISSNGLKLIHSASSPEEAENIIDNIKSGQVAMSDQITNGASECIKHIKNILSEVETQFIDLTGKYQRESFAGETHE